MNSLHSLLVEIFKLAKNLLSCESQSALRCSAVGESNCCSSGAGSRSRSDVEVKVTELCEPTGDVMYRYIYYIYVVNPNTRALDVLWDVLNKYEAGLVVSSSWWMKDVITVSTESSHRDKPRPLCGTWLTCML